MWALRHLPWISRSALRVAKPRLFSSAPSVASDLSMNSIVRFANIQWRVRRAFDNSCFHSARISNSCIHLRVDQQVKVFATIAPPNYALPWQNHPLKNVTGSGFIISGQRILTNAHVVADQAFVMVRKHGSPERFAARVLAAGHDCDLALLAVEDPSFFDSTLPVQFGGLPRLEDEVSVVGYPTGGDNISVTRGIVSRVEPQQYAHGTTTLLAIQIDAAINPGNSGGPAFQGSKVVGVAFQNLQGAENIGFVIPTTIIDHFLTDVERNASKNRPHAGFSSLGLHCQAMENINLRLFKKMKQGQVLFSILLRVGLHAVCLYLSLSITARLCLPLCLRHCLFDRSRLHDHFFSTILFSLLPHFSRPASLYPKLTRSPRRMALSSPVMWFCQSMVPFCVHFFLSLIYQSMTIFSKKDMGVLRSISAGNRRQCGLRRQCHLSRTRTNPIRLAACHQASRRTIQCGHTARRCRIASVSPASISCLLGSSAAL